MEPLAEQINSGLQEISPTSTRFDGPIHLSPKAMILLSLNRYNSMLDEEKEKIDNQDEQKRNVRFYNGSEDMATGMLLNDKRFIYLETSEKGYSTDIHSDAYQYACFLEEKQKELLELLKMEGRIAFYKRKKKFHKGTEVNQADNYKMISGLTKKVEGSIDLDDTMYASTDIGKTRENQEDAVLLIKDKENPNVKMVVVADGMGGWQNGEVASNKVICELRDWFENLTDEQKKAFDMGIGALKEELIHKIGIDIQSKIEVGGTTIVCALVGKSETMIANIGDSRAYQVKDGKLLQVSREDTVAWRNFENGLNPTKEVTRFDSSSNELLQCLGMNNRDLIRPHVEIIPNQEYDMLLLFTDGVTDCLSDEDIAVVCRTTDKKLLSKKIVEKALKHDSVEPEEYSEFTHLNQYIPGGKDNTTAAVIFPDDEER